MSSADGVVTSGSRRPVIVPRVGTHGQGPVIVPRVGGLWLVVSHLQVMVINPL